MAERDAGQSGAGALRPQAVLLVGPTASGKTPLGDALQAHGLWGRACAHFDFGRVLRSCVAGEGGWQVTPAERDRLEALLRADALLEDEDFPIAERLFRVFLARRKVRGDTLVVLNGLPRHTGQAVRMEPRVRMRAVLYLRCTEETVLARIRLDTGGDRVGRRDDVLARVRRRLDVFRRQTEPLFAHYRRRGVGVIPLDVEPETTAGALRLQLERHPPP